MTRNHSIRPQPGAEPAIVLLSGGLDSTTVLAIAKTEGFAVNALTFSYGQRHAIEVEAAKRIARKAGVARHEIIEIDLRVFGGSALTADIPVPKRTRFQKAGATATDDTSAKSRGSAPTNRDREPDETSSDSLTQIPVTYVPARNTIFLSYALAFAEVTGASNIFIGVNALDYSGYPDCRPEYIHAFEKMANLATRAGVEGKTRLAVRAPLVSLSKAAIIKLGASLGVDYSMTTSCYDPRADGEACGRCEACQLRLKGFSEAGLEDPIGYANTDLSAR